MLNCFMTESDQAIPIALIQSSHFPSWLSQQPETTRNWLTQQNFIAKPETFCCIPNAEGKITRVVAGQQDEKDDFIVGLLARALPDHAYCLETWKPLAAIAWGLGAYQFTRYKVGTRSPGRLVLPKEDSRQIIAQVKATYLVRDLINTPAEEMGPAQLANAAEQLAKTFSAQFKQVIGDDLLTDHYPAIHAVGRASHQAPRLIDLRWGDKHAPKLTLVGKGVCFDSGGLDLKSASGMAFMKKDMGGAAHVLGLAYLIMEAKLPVQLRVLIPAVENMVAGNAYRPGDVIKTRKGLSVEITNTDAEGRVILADALEEASRERPELIIDIATLTGAARVATGADLPAYFTNNDAIANTLQLMGHQQIDPVWRLPLHTPYRKLLDSPIADIANASNSPYAGAITAALFLKEFIGDPIEWIHFDLMGWNITSTPAHPEGGEAMAMRTLFAYLEQRFQKSLS